MDARDGRFTMPIRYSNQDFDEIQTRAAALTEADRAAGRPAPAYGYSGANVDKARAEYKAQAEAFYGKGA